MQTSETDDRPSNGPDQAPSLIQTVLLPVSAVPWLHPDRGVSEHGLDLCGVGAALAEPGGEGVPAAVGPEPGDFRVVPGGERVPVGAGVGGQPAGVRGGLPLVGPELLKLRPKAK